jgi:hypothetical protein
VPGKMSTLEVVCHLYDEEREDFRQRLDLIAGQLQSTAGVLPEGLPARPTGQAAPGSVKRWVRS